MLAFVATRLLSILGVAISIRVLNTGTCNINVPGEVDRDERSDKGSSRQEAGCRLACNSEVATREIELISTRWMTE